MFDEKKANEPVDFIECQHLTDDFYGQPFILQPWEKEIVRDVYGTLNSRGYRQYSYAYLKIPKKNGKTTLIAGLGLYHLICDGPGGQIYCCAADREQASLVYGAMLQMIDQDDYLQKMLKVKDSAKYIENTETKTFLKVLSAEAYTKHGLNPTVVIFDELHAQPNRDLWDVMTFGAGAARKETLYWIITTAGDDPDRTSIGWEEHEYARRVRDGEIQDPYWYVKIYGAPEDADIFDEKTWFACNPSLGVSIDIDKVRQEATAARNNPAAERLFRWLRLNQWNKNKKRGWLPLTSWDATTGDWTREDLRGCYCYGGLDLATTWDMNGFALIFPPQKGWKDYRVIFDAWIPEDNMKERVRRDHVPYDEWARGGFLHPTEGDVTDYSAIRMQIQDYAKKYRIRELGYDKYNATETALMIIRAPTPKGDQLFRVYKPKVDMADNNVYQCRHIFYDLLDDFIEDTRPSGNGAAAVSAILNGTGFTGTSDIAAQSSAEYQMMDPVKALLGGNDNDNNAFVNRWGGEIERDDFTVRMLSRLGADRGRVHPVSEKPYRSDARN